MIELQEYRAPISYSHGLRKQMENLTRVQAGDVSGVLMSLQHQPCITFGRHADHGFLLASQDELSRQGVELVQTDRGGEVTAHNPGQIVIYPILPMKPLGLSPKKLVNLLLSAVVSTLKEIGIDSYIDNERPGVWVGDAKICAVGIRIQRRISSHGIALNVENDLSVFSQIVPCGITDGKVTRIMDQVADPPSVARVNDRLLYFLSSALGQSLHKVKV